MNYYPGQRSLLNLIEHKHEQVASIRRVYKIYIVHSPSLQPGQMNIALKSSK